MRWEEGKDVTWSREFGSVTSTTQNHILADGLLHDRKIEFVAGES